MTHRQYAKLYRQARANFSVLFNYVLVATLVFYLKYGVMMSLDGQLP